jgi:hypothetical protein
MSLGRKSRLWDVYTEIEPILIPGTKITANDAWFLCRRKAIGHASIVNNFRIIMGMLIETGHVVKLKRGVWFVKMISDSTIE